MAAKIRLKRVGRRGQPSYRVVVLDGQKPRDAKVVADLGHYDPKTNPPTFEIDGEGALKWLLEGAKATRAARGVLSKAGVMAAWDAAKRGETVEIEAKELKPTAKPKKAKAGAAEEPDEAAEPPAEAGEEPAEAGKGAPDGVPAEAEVEETAEAAAAEAADEEGDADEESEEEEKA
jgi:small subunit ribosomal protein S16